MPTTLQNANEKQTPRLDLANRLKAHPDTWARVCATLGSAVWAGLAVAARTGIAQIGAIELLFLFAPLVIVPLGTELGSMLTPRCGTLERPFSPLFDRIARRAQPFAAASVVVALLLPPGHLAGTFSSGWLLLCLLMAGSGLIAAFSAPQEDSGSPRFTLFSLTLLIARIDLVVGAIWLVASRLGMRPLGIQEPIGLLTAVHFHFAGFATAMIAAATLRFSAHRASERLLKWVVSFAIAMPYLVAIGFVISPALKMLAAIIFSASIAALAVILRPLARQSSQREGRILLQVAATSVFAAMVLSTVYAISDFAGSDMLPIPQMARTHGILNAFGFCMAGLLGWILEFEKQDQSEASPTV